MKRIFDASAKISNLTSAGNLKASRQTSQYPLEPELRGCEKLAMREKHKHPSCDDKKKKKKCGEPSNLLQCRLFTNVFVYLQRQNHC